jgi:hypothetical protein
MTINEFALLFAVSLPVATIVCMQVLLAATGERGTGLIPGLSSYPAIVTGKMWAPSTTVSEAATVDTSVASSNDEIERLAA